MPKVSQMCRFGKRVAELGDLVRPRLEKKGNKKCNVALV